MKIKKEKVFETMLALTGALVISFWITDKKIFLLFSLFPVGAGIFSYYIAEKISWAWMKLAEGLGFIMSRVILSVLFYLFLLPISFLYRLSKKDSLSLKKKELTYYHNRDHLYSSKDLENPW